MPAPTFLFNDAADSLAGRKKYDVLTFLGRHPQPSSPVCPNLPLLSFIFLPFFFVLRLILLPSPLLFLLLFLFSPTSYPSILLLVARSFLLLLLLFPSFVSFFSLASSSSSSSPSSSASSSFSPSSSSSSFDARGKAAGRKVERRDVGERVRVEPLHRGECITSPRFLLSSLAGSTAECGSIRSFVSERQHGQHATRGTGRRRGGRLTSVYLGQIEIC